MNFTKELLEDADITDMDKKLKSEGKKAFVYDPSGGLEGLPAPNLPDVGDVLSNVEAVLEYMCNDELIELKNKDEDEFDRHMEEKFPAFSFRYYALFKKIISGEDITPLFSMLGGIERIKKGDITIEEVEKDLGEELAEEYIYPHLNKNTLNGIGKKKKHRRKR